MVSEITGHQNNKTITTLDIQKRKKIIYPVKPAPGRKIETERERQRERGKWKEFDIERERERERGREREIGKGTQRGGGLS